MAHIEIFIHADDTEEMASLVRDLNARLNPGNVTKLDPIPFEADSNNPDPAPAPVAQSEVNQPSAMSVEDLRAGMTLKEARTTALPDGTRVAAGDYVMHNGEAWHIYHVYRGRVIAMNEANQADVLSTENCHPAPKEDSPRPGTAAAHLSKPDPVQAAHPYNSGNTGTSAPDAASLREQATQLVTSGAMSPDQVFAKLATFHKADGQSPAQTVDDLTPENRNAFKAFLDQAAQAPAASGMGF